MTKTKIIVLMGGKSPEHDVSLLSGRQVIDNLDKNKYEASSFVIPKSGKFDFDLFKNLTVDIVFLAMHGPFGEDGTIQGLLEIAGLPYTGAGVLASAIGMDKPVFKKLMEQAKIPIPPYLIFKKKDDTGKILKKFKYPFVVKPSNQGSSVGVSIVKDKDNLFSALNTVFKFTNTAVIEEYIKGIEITCGILGNEELIALPVVEIIPKNEFFNYEAKYTEGMSDEIVPARISPPLTELVQETAKKVYRAVGCRGFGRIDMIIKDSQPYVLEINTIPGLTPASLLPKAAKAMGLSYSQLLDKIIGFSR